MFVNIYFTANSLFRSQLVPEMRQESLCIAVALRCAHSQRGPGQECNTAVVVAPNMFATPPSLSLRQFKRSIDFVSERYGRTEANHGTARTARCAVIGSGSVAQVLRIHQQRQQLP